MKLLHKSIVLVSEVSAVGWFMLRNISPLYLLPVIPIGVLFAWLYPARNPIRIWLNGICAMVMGVVACSVVGEGVFDGKGKLALFFLMTAVALFALSIPKHELSRVAGWWVGVFLLIFCAMLIATVPGIRLENRIIQSGKWSDILILYLLIFLDPLSLGKEFRTGPIFFTALLFPFGVASHLAMGSGAFELAQYPYLSVWAGVAISAFHHTEGIILCLFYGLAIFRMAYFFIEFRKKHCNKKTIIV